jgi:putative OmpL-like beta-barrel porin-2
LLCVALSALRLTAQTTDSNSRPDQPSSAPTQSQESSSVGAPIPLSTPAITGPLQAAVPIVFDGGPLGKLSLDGIVSGTGLWQGNYLSSDAALRGSLANGQIFLQKTSGWWQFYVQAGAYNILALGTPFLSTEKALSNLYGPVPVAYLKVSPAKNTSIMIGALPTLMGAEYTFDFQNMNVERGLLWNQENAINRGIQVNQGLGKLTASLSWNDGYYSNRYSWLSGSLTYVSGPHSLSFIGMGNLGQTAFQTLATPVQNNGVMYAAIYTYTKEKWIIQPYYQYGGVPTNPSVGVSRGASTNGGALLLSRGLAHGFSLAGRAEYLASTGNSSEDSINLMYGPGSRAWSVTVTPTFQHQQFFARGEFSFVRTASITPGDAFGSSGVSPNQPRTVMEVGFMF